MFADPINAEHLDETLQFSLRPKGNLSELHFPLPVIGYR